MKSDVTSQKSVRAAFTVRTGDAASEAVMCLSSMGRATSTADVQRWGLWLLKSVWEGASSPCWLSPCQRARLLPSFV